MSTELREKLDKLTGEMRALGQRIQFRTDCKFTDVAGDAMRLIDAMVSLKVLKSRFSRIVWLEGPLSLLYGGLAESNRDEPWEFGYADWSAALGTIARQSMQAISASQKLRSLVGPPVWAVPGISNVVARPFVAIDHIINEAKIPNGASDYSTARQLLGQLERAIWGTLIYELATYFQAHWNNPFFWAAQVSSHGVFPVGYLNGELYLYHYKQ
jgi:hypothetical protein